MPWVARQRLNAQHAPPRASVKPSSGIRNDTWLEDRTDSEGYRVTADYQASHWWYRSRRELFLRQVQRAVRELAAPGRRPRLLDYGCATGFDLPLLAAFADVEGADIAAAQATRDAGAAFPVHELPRDLRALRGRFQVVTCLDVLEHLQDDVAGLREIATLLVPSGQVVATVPAYEWLWSGEDVISQHRRRYTLGRLRRACMEAGFSVLWDSYYNLSILPAMAAVVWTRRVTSHDWTRQTNLSAGGRWSDRVAGAVATLEARLVGDEHLRLPAGASLVCRIQCRK